MWREIVQSVSFYVQYRREFRVWLTFVDMPF